VRRIHSAYPDLLPLSHVLRPGFLPGDEVLLDPIRMAIVWQDAPHRVLPKSSSVPRSPVRAFSFCRVASQRPEALERLVERGSAVLLVIDDHDLGPSDFHFDSDHKIMGLLPVLPEPLGRTNSIPESWADSPWGAVIGHFPFPGAFEKLDVCIARLKNDGARFVLNLPLLLTPKDRHRILETLDGDDQSDAMENALFHSDISRGLVQLEKKAARLVREAGIEETLGMLVPSGFDPGAVKTAAELRLWARRMDQCRQESSRGWRLRRAAAALEPLQTDPRILASENNLRVIPGFEPWVEELTRSLWGEGSLIDEIWQEWIGADSRSGI